VIYEVLSMTTDMEVMLANWEADVEAAKTAHSEALKPPNSNETQ